MELYVLDSLLRRIEVVDQFDSLIWTERYTDSGDFELVIPSNSRSKSFLNTGQFLALNQSTRVMKVESVEDKEDSDGRSLLSIKGPSLEESLKDRVARSQLAPTASDFKWKIKDTPGNIARKIFNDICVLGVLDPKDILPYIVPGNMYPADTILEYSDQVEIELTPNTVYDILQQICTSYSLGFRLTRNQDTGQIFFNVYSGSDRTTKQLHYAPVIFSQTLGNLTDTTYLTSISGQKNVAYVIGPTTTQVVYAQGYESSTGFDRKVMTVDGTDATQTGAALTAELIRRGTEALAQNKSLQGMDGSISQYSDYVYNVHYNLGDLVEVRNSDGITTDMKVTEQIFSSDETGEKSYPTLTTDLFITPGSWYSGTGAHIWNDALGAWADQP